MAGTNLNMLHRTATNKASDECYTPPAAILPIMKYLDPSMTYYEATSGGSAQMIHTMRWGGFEISEARGDFFNADITEDVIFTNPPFSDKDKWLRRCYDLGKPFALLLPVSSIQGGKRGAMFDRHGLDLLVLNERVDFTGKKSPHFGVAWFTWGILPERLIFESTRRP